jgi:hypothetical protein
MAVEQKPMHKKKKEEHETRCYTKNFQADTGTSTTIRKDKAK